MNIITPKPSVSANPKNSGTPEISITTGALPGSKKAFLSGVRHPEIRVPVREVALDPSAREPAVLLYDPSGPYTDAAQTINIERGIARPREGWISGRSDVESYPGRQVKSEDNGDVDPRRAVPPFPVQYQPLRAVAGRAASPIA